MVPGGAGDLLALIEDDNESQVGHVPDETAEVKARIRDLVEEKKQRDDYAKRLQRKIGKLSTTLGDVVEEEEGLRRKQDMELGKKEKESHALKSELASKARNQENRIREQLSNILFCKPPTMNQRHYELDTVKVVYERFPDPLAFRIDDGLTVMRLRNYACKYWSVPPDNFILKTMANNKCSDDIRVKNCFKHGELSQLRLEEKQMVPAQPSEEELKSIMAKGKGRRLKMRDPRFNTSGIERVQKYVDGQAAHLKKFGGVYFLLKLQDSQPSEHGGKIKLRDIIIYSLLLVLSLLLYHSRRPHSQDYWLMRGVHDSFDMEMPRAVSHPWEYQRTIPKFSDVRRQEDVWDWLETTLPAIVWSNSNFSFGSYNLMVGYLALRVKHVVVPDPPKEACMDMASFTERIGGSCYDLRARSDEEDTRDNDNITAYWDSVVQADRTDPQAIRSGRSNPGEWVSDDYNRRVHHMDTLMGSVDLYDAAGYSVMYKMQALNNTKAKLQYAQDLEVFRKNGWISLRTRVVVISFTIYNHDYDMWVSSDFLFEMAPTGVVSTHELIRPFKPRLDETRTELRETAMDIARVVICIYILVFVGMNERRHKIKYHKAGAWYHVSLTGITDYGMCACIFVMVFWRTFGFRGGVVGEVLEMADDTFISFSGKAWAYNNIFAMEGLTVIFLGLRIVSLMRLNRTVYLMWASMGRAFRSSMFFTLMFTPAIFGFALILQGTFGPHLKDYGSLQLTAMQFFKLVHGGLDPVPILKLDVAWGVIFIILFYVLVTFLLMNIYAAIVVDAYYVTQITSGGPGEQWTWQRWYKWAVPPLVVNLIQGLSAGQRSITSYVEGA